MKYFLIAILLVTTFCKNTEQEKESKYEKSQNTYFSILWLLIASENEDPECGGGALRTLFGLNNNRINWIKLEENNTITSANGSLWYYESSKKSLITVTFTQGTPAKIGAICNNSGSLVTSYCNGVYASGINRQEPLALNQVYTYEANINTKNFLTLDRYTTDCNTEYSVKTEVIF